MMASHTTGNDEYFNHSSSLSPENVTQGILDEGTNTTKDEYTCDRVHYVSLILVVYPLAIIVISLLAFLANRGKCCRQKRNRRITCIFPINLLDGYKERLGYACIFGAMTVQLLDVLFKSVTLSGGLAILDLGVDLVGYPLLSPFVKAFLIIVNVVLITVAFYPLFACLTTDYRFAGAICGLVCTIYRLGVCIWIASECQFIKSDYTGKYTLVRYNTVYFNLPPLVCFSTLTVRFGFVAWKCISKRMFGFYPRSQPLAEKHHLLHVGRLFDHEPLPWHEEDLSSMSLFTKKKFIATFYYKRTPYFQFPTRLVATAAILVAATYQIGLMVIFPVWSFIRLIERASKSTQDLQNLTGELLASFLEPFRTHIERWARTATALWTLTTCITVGIAVLYLYQASICYKKHMYRIYRGDKSMFPRSWVRQASQNIMTNAVRYAGIQVAYFMWGFVLIQIVLALILFFFVFVIIMPMADFKFDLILITVAEIVIIPTLITMAIYYSQVMLTRFVFLQPKINKTDQAIPLAVNNRHVFYNVSLFYFFFNMFLGVVSAVMRVLKAMVLGVFLIPRIDRSIMMHGYESLDGGFMCYLSMLTVIGTHDHPVLRVFLKLLDEGATDRKRAASTGIVQSRSFRRAQRNWQLCYTLLNNPGIIRYRKTNFRLEEIDHMARHRVVVAERRKAERTEQEDAKQRNCTFDALQPLAPNGDESVRCSQPILSSEKKTGQAADDAVTSIC